MNINIRPERARTGPLAAGTRAPSIREPSVRSLLALSLIAGVALSACSVRREALNAQLPVLRASVERDLAADELASAERVARDLEARLPGVDTYVLLGRVLWRTGDLLDAEAFHRRAAVDGLPEGLLGLARARIAEAEIEAGEDLRRLLEVPSVAGRAGRLLAAALLAEGRTAAAAQAFRRAADAAEAPGAAGDRAMAAALESIDGPYATWVGEPDRLTLEPGVVVAATLDGRPVRAMLSLAADRSAVASRLLGPEPDAPGEEEAEDDPDADSARRPRLRAARVGLGAMEATVLLEEAELPEGVDLRVGFDLLASLSWALDLTVGTFAVAPAAAGPAPPLDLGRTHWMSARVPRDALAVQLLVFPRVEGRVQSTALDLTGGTRLDVRVARRLELGQEGRAEVEVRMGAWRGDVEAEIVDLYPLGADGAIAPRAVLGADVLRGWRLVWRPGRAELVLERHP